MSTFLVQGSTLLDFHTACRYRFFLSEDWRFSLDRARSTSRNSGCGGGICKSEGCPPFNMFIKISRRKAFQLCIVGGQEICTSEYLIFSYR
jgi:hypothetical protein